MNRKIRLCPAALILSPTRELAIQIFEEATKFCYHTGLKVAVVYGGTKVAEQMFSLVCPASTTEMLIFCSSDSVVMVLTLWWPHRVAFTT